MSDAFTPEFAGDTPFQGDPQTDTPSHPSRGVDDQRNRPDSSWSSNDWATRENMPPARDYSATTLAEVAEGYPGYAYIFRLAQNGGVGDPTGRPQDAAALLGVLEDWISQYNLDDSDGIWENDAGTLAAALADLDAQIEASDWFIHRAPELRAALIQEQRDPGGWAKGMAENSEDIRQAARALGLELSEQEVSGYARTALQEDWDQNYLEEELAQAAWNENLQPATGSIRSLYNQLLGFADKQLLSDTGERNTDYWRMAWDISRGDDTLSNAYQEINATAAGEWQLPGWDFNTEWEQNQETLDRRLNGVRSTVANLWGMAPDALNLADMGSSFLVTGEGDDRRLITAQEADLKARMDSRYLAGPVYKREVGRIGSGLNRMMEQ